MSRLRLPLFVVALIAVAACSPATTPLAVIASSQGSIGIGQQRILVALVDVSTNDFLASEDREASMLLRDEDGTPIGTYDLEFVWTVPDVRGVYSVVVDIPQPGVYQVVVSADGLNDSGPTGFSAVEDPANVSLGDSAPETPTRTVGEFPDLAVISSDPDPDPALYQLSLDEAISDGKPTVVVFATPAFCTSEACGPMLDQVKALRPGYPDVDFIHVEVYEDLQVESLEDLTVVSAVEDWGLPSEPWVYVIDRSGVVSALFEGAVSDTDLEAALDAVTGS